MQSSYLSYSLYYIHFYFTISCIHFITLFLAYLFHFGNDDAIVEL